MFFLRHIISCELCLMNDLIKTGVMVHIYKVKELISTRQNFIRCARSDRHTTVSVALNDLMHSERSKKNSSFLQDMMDIVVTSPSRKQKNELPMEKNALYDLKYRKEKLL